jgi:hypothetical protein
MYIGIYYTFTPMSDQNSIDPFFNPKQQTAPKKSDEQLNIDALAAQDSVQNQPSSVIANS